MADEQLFGKYRLVRRLAFGGMAEIFLAQLVGDEGFQKSVVLKRILPQFSADPDFTRMFVDEAVLAAKLTHPNVAQVYDFGQVDGVYFITMERVDGTDLRKLIRASSERNRPLTAVEVAAIGEGMAKGLSYVHAVENEDGQPLSIVHRDISPHNVMVSRGGDVKIMDFGIAKAAARATQTATGTIKGKLAYMAPEQALGEEVDKLSDQFAVGLVLWECVVGKRLFESDSEPELLSRVAAGRVRQLRDFAPDVPAELERVIMRALSVERGRRYPDLRDLEQDLANFRYAMGSAGAVRLSSLVDDLIPREPSKSVREAGTAVLGAQSMSTSSPSQESYTPENDPWGDTAAPGAAAPSDPSLKMQSGWSQGAVATDPTRPPALATEPFHATHVALEPEPSVRRRGRAAFGLVAAAVVLIGLAAGASVRFGGRERSILVVESDPPGAHLLVSSPPGSPMLPTGLVTPATVKGHAIGDALTWRLEMPGMRPLQRTTSLASEVQREKVTLDKDMVVAALEPPPDNRLASDRTPTIDNRATTTDNQEPNTEDGTPTDDNRLSTVDSRASFKIAKADRLDSKSKKGQTGFLSLRTRGPWVQVYLNKKKIGDTPFTHLEVPAGLLTLQLRNPSGLSRSATIDVPVGGSIEQTIDTN